MPKKIMVVGPMGSGKSTLVEYFERDEDGIRKTVVPEYHKNMLDTPGEYMEHRVYYGNLQVIACDYECVAMVVACDSVDVYFPPNIVQIFLGKPCIGVVSKVDIGTLADIKRCRDVLAQAGVSRVFEISVKDNRGMDALRAFIEEI